MQSVFFANKGIIDIIGMTTFGVSIKDNQNPIGFFGTGFKYAIAVILRNGGQIKVRSGDHKYEFTSKTINARNNTPVNIVHMNDQPLSFTTHVGVNWKMWMAYRELFCNAIDEDGIVTTSFKDIRNMDTIIEVVDKDIYASHINKDNYFLNKSKIKTLVVDPEMEVYDKPSSNVFYRGINVGILDGMSNFTYNILTKIDLTEDRTLKYNWALRYIAERVVARSTNSQFIAKVLRADEHFESHLMFGPGTTCSEVFIKTAEDLLNKGLLKNESARKILVDASETRGEYPIAKLNGIQEKQLAKAKHFIYESLGYKVDDYKITVVKSLSDNVMGRVINDDQILISLKAFEMGTKQVTGTVLEEYLHIARRVNDCSYKFQNILIDTICTLMEKDIGEPL